MDNEKYSDGSFPLFLVMILMLVGMLMLCAQAKAEVFLVGTIVGNPSIATVRSGDRVLSLRVGEWVDKWQIKRIDARQVVIGSQREDRVIRTGEYLDDQGKLERGLKVTNDEVVMSPDVHRYITQEGTAEICMEATATEVTRNGKIFGYRIWNFDPGSVFDLAGLRNDDVIVEIDGVPIDSPATAIGLLKQVKNKSAFTFKLQRDAAVKTVKVSVKAP